MMLCGEKRRKKILCQIPCHQQQPTDLQFFVVVLETTDSIDIDSEAIIQCFQLFFLLGARKIETTGVCCWWSISTSIDGRRSTGHDSDAQLARAIVEKNSISSGGVGTRLKGRERLLLLLRKKNEKCYLELVVLWLEDGGMIRLIADSSLHTKSEWASDQVTYPHINLSSLHRSPVAFNIHTQCSHFSAYIMSIVRLCRRTSSKKQRARRHYRWLDGVDCGAERCESEPCPLLSAKQSATRFDLRERVHRRNMSEISDRIFWLFVKKKSQMNFMVIRNTAIDGASAWDRRNESAIHPSEHQEHLKMPRCISSMGFLLDWDASGVAESDQSRHCLFIEVMHSIDLLMSDEGEKHCDQPEMHIDRLSHYVWILPC